MSLNGLFSKLPLWNHEQFLRVQQMSCNISARVMRPRVRGSFFPRHSGKSRSSKTLRCGNVLEARRSQIAALFQEVSRWAFHVSAKRDELMKGTRRSSSVQTTTDSQQERTTSAPSADSTNEDTTVSTTDQVLTWWSSNTLRKTNKQTKQNNNSRRSLWF